MRKLVILGLILCISLCVQAQEEFGIASYYADAFHGRKTASGALYHKDKLTAAHKNLPFGTILRVTRLDNKQSVKVTVNDRGPYIKGRIIDLSKAAAKKLDLITDGKARVKIEVISKGSENLVASNIPVPNLESLKSEERKAKEAAAIAENIENPIPTSLDDTSKERISTEARDKVSGESNPKSVAKNTKPAPDLTVAKGPAVTKAKPAPKAAPAAKTAAPKKIETLSTATMVKGQDYKAFDLYKIQLMRPAKGGYGVQVASITQYENVMKQVAKLQEKWFNNILVSVEPGKDDKPVYKLILGPFPDRATADSYKKDLKKKKKMDGFVVDLSQVAK